MGGWLGDTRILPSSPLTIYLLNKKKEKMLGGGGYIFSRPLAFTAILSGMFMGASAVHLIMKPDLTVICSEWMTTLTA